MSSTLKKDLSLLPKQRIIVEQEIKDISVDSIMQDALLTAATEVVRYRQKVTKGLSLDLKEARIVQGWMKSMVELSREQREQERLNDLSKLSRAELLALATKYLKQEQPDDDDDKETE